MHNYLDENGRVAETRGEFQRIDALAADDAVQVEVADVAFLGQLAFQFLQGLVEDAVWS